VLDEVVEREGASKRCAIGAAFGRRQGVVSAHVRDRCSAGGTGSLRHAGECTRAVLT
jgi:hypothetical protein